MKFKSLSHVQLFATPCTIAYGLLRPWIVQARLLQWVAISFSRESSWPRDRTRVSCITGRHFTIRATREAWSPTSRCIFTVFYIVSNRRWMCSVIPLRNNTTTQNKSLHSEHIPRKGKEGKEEGGREGRQRKRKAGRKGGGTECSWTQVAGGYDSVLNSLPPQPSLLSRPNPPPPALCPVLRVRTHRLTTSLLSSLFQCSFFFFPMFFMNHQNLLHELLCSALAAVNIFPRRQTAPGLIRVTHYFSGFPAAWEDFYRWPVLSVLCRLILISISETSISEIGVFQSLSPSVLWGVSPWKRPTSAPKAGT